MVFTWKRHLVSLVLGLGLFSLLMAFLIANSSDAHAQAGVRAFVGDATIQAKFGDKAQSVGPDSDAGTGQIIIVRGATSVNNYSQYWNMEIPEAHIDAWVNELLRKGCEGNRGCGSVRIFEITEAGIKSRVVNRMIAMNPKVQLTAAKSTTEKNRVFFTVQFEEVGLYDHTIRFGDGEKSLFMFNDPVGRKVIDHHFPHNARAKTYHIVVEMNLASGGVISDTMDITVRP